MIIFMICKTYIYTLSDSIGNIRYIGKTDNPKRRLKEHIYESKNTPKNHRHYWILSLLNNNEIPKLEILDCVNHNEWDFWEKHYISLIKSWGFNLTNQTEGGDSGLGMLGKKHKEETKEKIKIANSGKNHYNFGKKLSKEHKEKLSNSLSGNKNPFFGKKHSEKTLNEFRKKILQYDLNGNFIKEWDSIKDAEVNLNIHSISSVCNKKLKSAGGFFWAFKESENFDLKLEIKYTYRKKVLQFSLENELIKEWNSIKEIERNLKIYHISKVCNNVKNYNTAGGFKWEFK